MGIYLGKWVEIGAHANSFVHFTQELYRTKFSDTTGEDAGKGAFYPTFY
jgi:hypothetical protein